MTNYVCQPNNMKILSKIFHSEKESSLNTKARSGDSLAPCRATSSKKSWPLIRRPTAGGWPSPSSPRPAPRGRWPRPPPACADRRRTPRLPPATMCPSPAPTADSAGAPPLPSSLPGAAELCGADGPRCGQLPAEARRAEQGRTAGAWSKGARPATTRSKGGRRRGASRGRRRGLEVGLELGPGGATASRRRPSRGAAAEALARGTGAGKRAAGERPRVGR